MNNQSSQRKKKNQHRIYIAIDLKSFYASVECVDRGLNPLTTNLVVADQSRTDKTICLAVTPSLKAFGVPGRPRLFEVINQVRTINALREQNSPNGKLIGSAIDGDELNKNPALGVDYLVAPPRMARYIEVSTQIYEIYLRFIAPEDIHVYSIDEVFIDVTDYLDTYRQTPRELAMTIIKAILADTGITATAGIGTNLYLCKVAMDIVAKHLPADENGVRIAELDEFSYRQKLWNHRPLTDFWRIGKGIARKLENLGLMTMGDIAKCSLGNFRNFYNENLLFNTFGVNAELIIDHAWGIETTTMPDIKAYRPEMHSLSNGQVLKRGYTYDETTIILQEMIEALALRLVSRGLSTDCITLTIRYDDKSFTKLNEPYYGDINTDHHNHPIPKHAHGSLQLGHHTASTSRLVKTGLSLFEKIVNKELLIRRVNITAEHVLSEVEAKALEKKEQRHVEQVSFFCNPKLIQRKEIEEKKAEKKERDLQKALLAIKKRYGANAIVKGMSLTESATGMERNESIGGHKA